MENIKTETEENSEHGVQGMEICAGGMAEGASEMANGRKRYGHNGAGGYSGETAAGGKTSAWRRGR